HHRFALPFAESHCRCRETSRSRSDTRFPPAHCALIYSTYSASKFIFAGTPAGVSLSPEGGAHQSAVTVSLGMELPNLCLYEPCLARETEWCLLEGLRQCLDREHGTST